MTGAFNYILKHFNFVANVIELPGDVKLFQKDFFVVSLRKKKIQVLNRVNQRDGFFFVIGDVVFSLGKNLLPLEGLGLSVIVLTLEWKKKHGRK